MSDYESPNLRKYGSVQDLTGRFGPQQVEDQFTGADGTTLAGTGSTDGVEQPAG